MKSYTVKNQLGFTLIEILLYMGLSTIMVILIGGIGVNVFSGFVKAKAAEELQYNTQFLTEKIHNVVSQSAGISEPGAGAESSTLVLSMDDATKNPTVIDMVDGRVRITEGVGAAQFLSGSGTVVSRVLFSNSTHVGGAGSLRTVLEIGQQNPEDRTIYFASSTIHTTVNLQYP